MSLSAEHLNDLSHIIRNNFEEDHAPAEMNELANEFAALLKEKLEKERMFQAKGLLVDIFGSLRNGLGTKSSDVDIILRIPGTRQAPDELLKDTTAFYLQNIIEPLTNKNKINCEEVEPVLDARVPILKIKWRSPQNPEVVLEGDITFYHALAIQHSDLIKAYCDWDPRVQQLGLFLKKWSKRSGIGSACDGYLSSFSWALMLIQYMQSTQPPAIVNLQKTGKKGKRVVFEGPYNVYFYRGKNPAKFLWQKTDTSLGALFVGFLRYYANYNYYHQRICIQSDKRGMGNHHPWRAIVIRDPFTGQYYGIQRGDYEKRRDNIINCLRQSYEAFTSRDVRENWLDLRSNDYDQYLCDYEDAILDSCPKIKNPPTKEKFVPKKSSKFERRWYREHGDDEVLDSVIHRLRQTGISIPACA